jgi:hypothetical protein
VDPTTGLVTVERSLVSLAGIFINRFVNIFVFKNVRYSKYSYACSVISYTSICIIKDIFITPCVPLVRKDQKKWNRFYFLHGLR